MATPMPCREPIAPRAVGGYVTDRDCMAWQDWMTHLKLAKAGYRVDVLPEVLFYYRVRGDGLLKQSESQAREYPMRLRLLKQYRRSDAVGRGAGNAEWARAVAATTGQASGGSAACAPSPYRWLPRHPTVQGFVLGAPSQLRLEPGAPIAEPDPPKTTSLPAARRCAEAGADAIQSRKCERRRLPFALRRSNT